jgi:pimeloyl-ACP methyl ester carboxylesterase
LRGTPPTSIAGIGGADNRLGDGHRGKSGEGRRVPLDETDRPCEPVRSTKPMILPLLGKEIELARLAPARRRADARPILFLHEALGSVSHWRDFPRRLADAAGCEAIVYSRYGHGRSTPRLEPFGRSYLHDEALVWLPALLDALALDQPPFLFGHSDGASIALIAAGGSGRRFPGLIVLAPHVMVERVGLEGIERAMRAYRETDFAERLARHHTDADAVFRRWHEAWLHPAHRTWNIEAYLPPIECPILAIQGDRDEYATMEQIDRIARQAPRVERLELAGGGHLPHRDRTDMVIAATTAFLRREELRSGRISEK